MGMKMQRLWLAGMGLALAIAPATVQAQGVGKAACVMDQLSADHRADLAREMMGSSDDGSRGSQADELRSVIKACVAKLGIPNDQAPAYAQFVVANILLEWTRGNFATYNIPTGPIDAAVGFQANISSFDAEAGVTDEQGEAIIAAYDAVGIDVRKFDDPKLELIGYYVGALGHYWKLAPQFGS